MKFDKTGELQENLDLMTTIRFIFQPKMRLIAPLIVFRGVSLSTQVGLFVNFWVSTINTDPVWSQETEDQKIERVVYTFVFLGIGSILGSSILGVIQDKFGHKYSISFILFTICWTLIGLLIQNERHVFDWSANLTMFGAGMIDNCLTSFLGVVLGFEFDSKIIPFGAKNFVENITLFVVLSSFSLFGIEGKGSFRIYFIMLFFIGVTTTTMLYYVKYKK